MLNQHYQINPIVYTDAAEIFDETSCLVSSLSIYEVRTVQYTMQCTYVRTVHAVRVCTYNDGVQVSFLYCGESDT